MLQFRPLWLLTVFPTGRKSMTRDVKEIVGVLMRVLDGGEVSHDQLMELSFEAEGELQSVLNQAYIALLEFSHDQELRLRDVVLDREMRSRLQTCLDQIIAAWDQQSCTSRERSSA